MVKARVIPSLAALAVVAGLLAPAVGRAEDLGTTLTIYNGQDEGPVEAAAAAFEKKTGVKVSMRAAGSPTLANQLVEEGDKSPADIFYSEYGSPLAVLTAKGLLAEVPVDTVAQIPAKFSEPGHHWVGITGRSRVAVYNTTLLDESKLPASVLDFAKPEWDGKVGFAPQSAAFVEQLMAVEKMAGREAAKAWLTALKEHGKIYPKNTGLIIAVNRGEIQVAINSDNYLYAVIRENGGTKINAANHYFTVPDAGGLVTISGAAMLKSAPHPAAAKAFLAFLVSPEGQQVIANAADDAPLRSGITSPFAIKSIDERVVPPVTEGDIGDAQDALDLEKEVGLN